MSQLQELRQQIDDFMGHHPQSPLAREQQNAFAGLEYYDEDADFAFVVTVERFPDSEPLIVMETSTGDKRPYRRWGRFSITVDGEMGQLTIFSDPDEDDFFLPFRDATSGKETYGAGRYMDSQRPGLRQIAGNQIEIDFNFVYNPYCAYNERFSCPLPPVENWLKISIRAGEKKFR
jgi:hypothetical protein